MLNLRAELDQGSQKGKEWQEEQSVCPKDLTTHSSLLF
jgi:hypothetical protein